LIERDRRIQLVGTELDQAQLDREERTLGIEWLEIGRVASAIAVAWRSASAEAIRCASR